MPNIIRITPLDVNLNENVNVNVDVNVNENLSVNVNVNQNRPPPNFPLSTLPRSSASPSGATSELLRSYFGCAILPLS